MTRTPALAGLLLIGVLATAACGADQQGAASIAPSATAVAGAASAPAGSAPAASAPAASAPAASMPAASTAGAPTSTTAPTTAPAAAAGDIKACRLLTAAEVTAVIGTNSGPTGSGSTCQWENEQNYHSITVEIGDTGTAVGGTLPAPLPGASTAAGPNGIRFSSGNVAEFLIGDRACQVQVVTSVTDDSDRPTAVRLIGLIRSRVGS